MREKDKICHYKALEKLSTQELDRLLQEELRRETPNEEVVLPILQILQEREAEYSVEISNDTEDAWNAYRDHVGRSMPATPVRKWNWIGKIAAVAAIVCVLIMAIPNTVGAESIFDVLFRWTESVFEFLTPGESNDPPVDYVFETDNPGLQQLYDKVVEMGITEPVVPMWLPEGYELVELKVTTLQDGDKTYARYTKGDSEISLSYVSPSESMSIIYEKLDDVEVYECFENKHFIFRNDVNLSVVWTNNSFECIISTDLDREKIYQVIKSVYRR